MKSSKFGSFALVLALSVVSCSKSGDVEPTYEGCATDEHKQTFDDYESTDRVKTSAQASPKWLQPIPGPAAEDFPSNTPVKFSWQPTASNPGSTQGNISCSGAGPTAFRGALRPQHETPVSGLVYDIKFSIGDHVSYRVITSRQTTSVPADIWADWAGQSIAVDLVSAQLLSNELSEGPYRSVSQLTFRVK